MKWQHCICCSFSALAPKPGVCKKNRRKRDRGWGLPLWAGVTSLNFLMAWRLNAVYVTFMVRCGCVYPLVMLSLPLRNVVDTQFPESPFTRCVSLVFACLLACWKRWEVEARILQKMSHTMACTPSNYPCTSANSWMSMYSSYKIKNVAKWLDFVQLVHPHGLGCFFPLHVCSVLHKVTCLNPCLEHIENCFRLRCTHAIAHMGLAHGCAHGKDQLRSIWAVTDTQINGFEAV